MLEKTFEINRFQSYAFIFRYSHYNAVKCIMKTIAQPCPSGGKCYVIFGAKWTKGHNKRLDKCHGSREQVNFGWSINPCRRLELGLLEYKSGQKRSKKAKMNFKWLKVLQPPTFMALISHFFFFFGIFLVDRLWPFFLRLLASRFIPTTKTHELSKK